MGGPQPSDLNPVSPQLPPEELVCLSQDTTQSDLSRMADIREMKSMTDGLAGHLSLKRLHAHDHPFCGQMSVGGVQINLQ